MSELEIRLGELDMRRESLAKPSMRTGVGAIGYRSRPHKQANHTEWIRIELGEPVVIDQIVLVPTIWRDTQTGYRADGFPTNFQIVAGIDDNSPGTVIASFSEKDRLLPRVAPVVVPCAGTTASWVRLEATRLSARAWDGKFILQLSEIMVFSGPENIALRQPVTALTTDDWVTGSRNKDFLVDGFVPYLMDAQAGQQSIAYVAKIESDQQAELSIDLGQVQTVNRIHLHSTDLSDTVPQAEPADFGIPRRFALDGATRSDFSDAVHLLQFQMESPMDAGPIIMRRFPQTPCRYVRLIAVDPYVRNEADQSSAVIGLAEIELFSHGRNVAMGKPVQAELKVLSPDRSLKSLTDGNNLYGEILPVRDWMEQLAERHTLEVLRPQVIAELNDRYRRQAARLRWLIWLAAALAVVALGTFAIDAYLRQLAVQRTRQRIAADLHDELGANLHAIALLGDLVQRSVDSPNTLTPLLQRMRELIDRTGKAAAYCANMLESGELFDDWESEMRRDTARILADLDHELIIEDEESISRLKSKEQIDLLLFYKECLINVLRHSGATRVQARLCVEDNNITLSVSDNGRGISANNKNGIPRSLKRRARLLGGRVTVEHPQSGGTIVSLKLRNPKFRVFT